MRLPILAIVFVWFTTPSRVDAQGSPPLVSVERLMTVEQFRAAGLPKLSPDELTALNAWLQHFALSAMQAAAQQPSTTAPTASATTADAIETRIEGEFNGWEGETVFKLDNGQIWQQASYAYTYHYAYRPKVLIYKSGSSYRMKVDGVDATIFVKRLK